MRAAKTFAYQVFADDGRPGRGCRYAQRVGAPVASTLASSSSILYDRCTGSLLFTRVRGRRILRTSQREVRRKYEAPAYETGAKCCGKDTWRLVAPAGLPQS